MEILQLYGIWILKNQGKAYIFVQFIRRKIALTFFAILIFSDESIFLAK